MTDFDWLTRIACDAEQEATKRLTCRRKAVCTSLVLWKDTTVNFYNGPLNDDPKRCSNQVGGCGCIHSEFRAMVWLLEQAPLMDVPRATILVTYSPCTSCANLIVLCKDYVDGVYWLYDTEHDMRGIEILQAGGLTARKL